MLDADGLAEGEELEANILRVLLRKCAKYCEAIRRQKCGLNGRWQRNKNRRPVLADDANLERKRP